MIKNNFNVRIGYRPFYSCLLSDLRPMNGSEAAGDIVSNPRVAEMLRTWFSKSKIKTMIVNNSLIPVDVICCKCS